MKLTSRMSSHKPHLELVAGGKGLQSTSRLRKDEATRLNLKYTAAKDRQARILEQERGSWPRREW